MTRVAVDFGTSNSIVAHLDESNGDVRSLEIAGITRALEATWLPGEDVDDAERHAVHVVPTLIHYAEGTTLIGEQVRARDLVDHPHTLRWVKRAISAGVSKRRKTPQGHKSPAEAGADFLELLLRYAAETVSLAEDEFVFTVPVESFDTFRDWLERVCETLGVRRFRLMDEATATVLAGQEAVRREDRFLVFDFGCGTLDVSAVRLELDEQSEKTAVQLGQAGDELGGLDIDEWLASDFRARHSIEAAAARRIEPALLSRAECVKVALSSPECEESELAIDDGPDRHWSTLYRRACASCELGAVPHCETAGSGCLGCVLAANDFPHRIQETVERALENAAVKSGLRRKDLTAVLTTGGTSLVPRVRRYLTETFLQKVRAQNPFDALVRGACRGAVAPILQHDYAIESYNRELRAFEFQPLLNAGTEYPTAAPGVRLWAKGSCDGMSRIGIKIFEVSRMKRTLSTSLVEEDGAIRDESRVSSEYRTVCLNASNPTFVVADPPIVLARDARRFLCAFRVDANRRLLVSVLDTLERKKLLEDHPVVRL